jgi:hypothetical protein
MKRVPNSILLKSSMSWCSALLRTTRRSLPLQIIDSLMLLLSLTGCCVLDPQGLIGAANLRSCCP